ncbi:rRNA methyltransferase 3, mitochondrial [Sitodiplosis mosellana]|uniref:rRNA methyltransferase 3, mitochondrial n=1 Tax=Sitodiplosis mosellana TaxID=263140 RepID=UPI0024448EE6|nr:rRNA methyltransferase 3, mitochondrial [Sitodiplosis mosellana]
MLGCITRSFSVLSPYVHKQRLFVNSKPQFVRLLSQSPVLNVVKQAEEDSTDLLFDLGGTAKSTDIEPKQTIKAAKVKKPKSQHAKPVGKPKEKLPNEKKERSFEQLKYHDLGLNLTYIKLPFDHPEFPKLMLMLKSRKYRDNKKLLLVEGRRLTLEAIEAGLKIRYLLFSNVKQVETIRDSLEKAFIKQTEIIRVPHNDLSTWSTLTTCPGLIAIFQRPYDMQTIWDNVRKAELKAKENANIPADTHVDSDEIQVTIQSNTFDGVPITVICDQVREPNNLGSIIRTCAAVPCTKIVLLKGCADPWDVKTLRGGCGAQFRVPIVGPIEWEDLTEHLPDIRDVSVFVADNQTQINDTKLPYDEFDQKRKQNNIKFIKPKVYSDIPFSNCKHIALVIGGETEGVSSHAFDFMKFATDHTSQADAEQNNENHTKIEEVRPDNAVVEIPLGNGIESLNASVATAILLFEIRKQLTQ